MPVGEYKEKLLSLPVFRVAVVGGGPGGMFSAWHLAAKAGIACEITIYEASDRLGGKIHTRAFPGAGIYEAGVAEIYDYSRLGPDPLLNLIKDELGLKVKPIGGGCCMLDGQVVHNIDALRQCFGDAAADAVTQFRARCVELLSPEAFYKAERGADNAHPWADLTADKILESEVSDPIGRHYLRVMSHSDVAAPAHLTNGLTLLKNALMDIDGYLDVVSVVGGNNQIVDRLARDLSAKVRLNAQVKAIEPQADNTYRLTVGAPGFDEVVIADYVIMALPLTALAIVDWRSVELRKAMQDHVAYFDRPGHYLRATLLFKRPFWREQISGDWWMTDAFEGACIYDESGRHDIGSWGALGFLITGNAALGMVNLSDERIIEMCLESLPTILLQDVSLFVEGRVHRWMASVNAWPGGTPVRARQINHQPLTQSLPGVFTVGDYLFDSTVNGVLDSADTATDLVVPDMLVRRQKRVQISSANFDKFAAFFEPKFMIAALKTAYSLGADLKLLLVGDHASLYLEKYRDAGYDAHCAYSSPTIAKIIPASVAKYAHRFNGTNLDFADREFDVVIETNLCQNSPTTITTAIDELKRVSRRGLIIGSVNSELTIETIEHHNLLDQVQILFSRWQWAEHLHAKGFDQALTDPHNLSKMWEFARSFGAGPGQWYENDEALLYSFYSHDTPNKGSTADLKAAKKSKLASNMKRTEYAT